MFLSRKEPKRFAPQKTTHDLSEQLVTVVDPAGASSEAYRTLRASLLYGLVDSPHKIIVIAGSGVGEGKTTACANLGVVLSQAGSSTLVMDGDLRAPKLHKLFNLPNLFGTTSAVGGEGDLREICHEPMPRLKVATAGPVPPNPTELLSAERFAEVLGQARREFDYVLVDTPPIQLVSDALDIAAHSDGVLFVIDSQNTSKASVRQSISRLDAVGARVLGTVMTKAKAPLWRHDDRGHAAYSYRGKKDFRLPYR